MKAKLFLLFFGLLGIVVQAAAKEKIYVNCEVTTHIVMPRTSSWWTYLQPRLWATSVPTIYGTHQALSGARLHQGFL